MSKDYDAIERAFKAWSSRKPIVDNPGPEWFTVKAFASKTGKSVSAADRIVKTMYDEGMLERAMYRVELGGTSRPVPHYKNK